MNATGISEHLAVLSKNWGSVTAWDRMRSDNIAYWLVF